jgi:hypothetical protein
MALAPASGSVAPTGWYVEVDLPDGAGGITTRTPAVAGDPEWTPSVNRLPSVDIPIPSAPYWLDGRANGAPARVWLDGNRLPIEEIDRVKRRRGNGRDELVLECIGGIALQQRVQRVYQNRAVPDAVTALITDETGLVPNVDQPSLTQTETTTLLEATTADDFRESLRPASGGSFGDATVALEIDESADTLRRYRSSWLWTVAPSGDADLRLGPANTATQFSDVDAGESEAVRWTDSDQDGAQLGEPMVKDIDLPGPVDYRIPDQHIGVKARVRDTDPATNSNQTAILSIRFQSDSENVAEFLVNVSDMSNSFDWYEAAARVDGFDDGLDPDEAILDVDARAIGDPNLGNFNLQLDAIALYDTRFSHSFDNNPSGGDGDGFESPQPFGGTADIATVTTGREFAPRTLASATVDIALAAPTASDPSGLTLSIRMPKTPSQEAGVAVPVTVPETIGADVATTTNTGQTTATVNPTTTPATARTEATVALAGAGTQSQTPTAGTQSHILDEVVVTAAATQETRLLGESFDDNLQTILGEIADLSRSVWAVAADGTTLSLEWTRPGERSPSGELSASAVDLDRITQRVEAATVIGGRVRRQTEITAAPETAVPLPDQRLIPGTEQVRPADGVSGFAADFDQLSDYEVDYQTGTLTATPDGDIQDGETLTVQYAFRPEGRFESSQFSGDPRRDEAIDVSTATTEQQAREAARQIVTESADSRIEASVALGGIDPTTSVVSELSVDALADVDASFRVTGLTATPGNPTVRLGTNRPLDEIVEQVERDLADVRRRI